MSAQPVDKMIFAIVQGDDYDDVVKALNKAGFYATVLNSSGGFLKKSSVTIMVGLNHEELPRAMEVLKAHGQRIETRFSTPMLFGGEDAQSMAIPVRVGGVVTFVVDVDSYQRF